MAASKRGVTQMDDKFADRMAELGDISSYLCGLPVGISKASGVT